MSYAGKYKMLTYLSLVLGAISGILALVPFIYIWLIIKEVIEVMPNFADATNMIHNGWMAVIFALLAMIVNFSALMCSHLSAFRIASNMRIKLLQHITKMPIGKLDEIGTGKLRKIVSEATASLDAENETEIQEAISKLVKNKTVLIIAHRMRTVTNADKIVLLKDGVVKEQGSPKELLGKDSIFKDMVNKQQESMEWKLN